MPGASDVFSLAVTLLHAWGGSVFWTAPRYRAAACAARPAAELHGAAQDTSTTWRDVAAAGWAWLRGLAAIGPFAQELPPPPGCEWWAEDSIRAALADLGNVQRRQELSLREQRTQAAPEPQRPPTRGREAGTDASFRLPPMPATVARVLKRAFRREHWERPPVRVVVASLRTALRETELSLAKAAAASPDNGPDAPDATVQTDPEREAAAAATAAGAAAAADRAATAEDAELLVLQAAALLATRPRPPAGPAQQTNPATAPARPRWQARRLDELQLAYSALRQALGLLRRNKTATTAGLETTSAGSDGLDSCDDTAAAPTDAEAAPQDAAAALKDASEARATTTRLFALATLSHVHEQIAAALAEGQEAAEKRGNSTEGLFGGQTRAFFLEAAAEAQQRARREATLL